MTYLEQLETKVLLERLVIGLEEPVLVKGLGELQAKIDSGNGGYNVIHGSDFHQQGDTLMFSTVDNFGHPKKISAKVIDTIEVNMGGGNIENRPVIELDIKFAGEDYKKIPFSVSDRSTNTHPILISKGFVEKELEALIDVGAKNISTDGIDVVYGESVVGKTLKGAANVGKKSLGTAGEGLWGAVKGAASWAGNTIKNAGDILHGDKKLVTGDNVKNAIGNVAKVGKGAVGLAGGAAMAAVGALTGSVIGICKLAKYIANLPKMSKEDITHIREQLPNSVLHSKLQKKDIFDLDNTIWAEYNKAKFDKVPIFPIVSFTGRTGKLNKGHVVKGMEKRVEKWKKALKAAQKRVKGAKGSNNGNVQEQQEYILQSLFIMQAIDQHFDATSQETVPQNAPQTTNTEEKQEGIPQDNKETDKENTPEEVQPYQDDSQIQLVHTQLESLNNFIIHFIHTGKQLNSDSQKKVTQIFESGKFDNIVLPFYNSGKITPDSAKKIIQSITKFMRKEMDAAGQDASLLQGCFAISTGELDKRKSFLYDDIEQAVVPYKQAKINDENEKNEGFEKFQEKLINVFPENITTILSDSNEIKKIAYQIVKQPSEYTNLLSQDTAQDLGRLERKNTKTTREELKQIENNLISSGQVTTVVIKQFIQSLDDENLKSSLENITNNKIFKSMEQFSRVCYNDENVRNIINSSSSQETTSSQGTTIPDEQSEEEIWINSKLSGLRTKGII